MGSGLEDEGTGGRETCGWIGGPMAIVEVVMVMPTMQRTGMLMVEKMDTLMKLLTRRIST